MSRLGLGVIVWIFLTGTVLAVMQFLDSDEKNSPWLFAAVVGVHAGFSGVALFALRKLRVKLDADPRLRLLLAVCFCVTAAFLSGGAAQLLAGEAALPTTARTVVGALGLQAGFLLLLPGFLREHKISFSEAFGFAMKPKVSLLVGALGAFIFLPIGLTLQMVSAHALMRFGWKAETQTVVNVLGNAHTWPERLTLAVITVLLAPVVEEILFRGILYPWVKRLGHPRLALWGVSLFFAAIHANLPTFLPLLVLAILLARLYENTRNLLAPIAVHSLFNATNFALFLLTNEFVKSLPAQS